MQQDKAYLIYDGVLFSSNALLLRTTNRAFRFGDGLFETMHYHKGNILFFDDHYGRLLRGMSIMRLSLKGLLPKNVLHERIVSLVVKNRLFGDAGIRLTLFRKESGVFTSESFQASCIIETFPIDEQGYIFNDKGYTVDIFSEFPKNASPLSPFRTISSNAYTLGWLYAKENRLDDCLIVNNSGKIIESGNSNLFWIKGETVYTPKIASGCIDGIFRKQLLLILLKLNLKIVETEGATIDEISNAEELFLTNAIDGIRWIVGFKNKRFYNFKIKEIFREFKKAIN